MRGWSAEIVEILSRRNVDIRFVNETRGRNESNQKKWERTVIISSFG